MLNVLYNGRVVSSNLIPGSFESACNCWLHGQVGSRGQNRPSSFIVVSCCTHTAEQRAVVVLVWSTRVLSLSLTLSSNPVGARARLKFGGSAHRRALKTYTNHFLLRRYNNVPLPRACFISRPACTPLFSLSFFPSLFLRAVLLFLCYTHFCSSLWRARIKFYAGRGPFFPFKLAQCHTASVPACAYSKLPRDSLAYTLL